MGRKEQIKKQSVRRSQHGAKCKPILASICLCQRFYCSSLRGKHDRVVDIVSRSLLHDPVAKPVDIFSTLQTQICELRTGYMVSHSERPPEMCCRMGFTVTCDPHTARQEAESLWDRPVMRVLKGSKQLPIKKRPFAVPLWQLLSQIPIWSIDKSHRMTHFDCVHGGSFINPRVGWDV